MHIFLGFDTRIDEVVSLHDAKEVRCAVLYVSVCTILSSASEAFESCFRLVGLVGSVYWDSDKSSVMRYGMHGMVCRWIRESLG